MLLWTLNNDICLECWNKSVVTRTQKRVLSQALDDECCFGFRAMKDALKCEVLKMNVVPISSTRVFQNLKNECRFGFRNLRDALISKESVLFWIQKHGKCWKLSNTNVALSFSSWAWLSSLHHERCSHLCIVSVALMSPSWVLLLPLSPKQMLSSCVKQSWVFAFTPFVDSPTSLIFPPQKFTNLRITNTQ